MKIFIIILLAISSQVFANEPLELIQKNCHFKELKESFVASFQTGTNTYHCQNNTKIQITYTTKAIHAIISQENFYSIVNKPSELSLIVKQMAIFYKDSDEFQKKQKYKYSLPVKIEKYPQWRYQ